MTTLKKLMDLSGRVALVTGGAGHIGYAMCEALAELGASVVLLDLESAGCGEAATRLSGTFGGQALGIDVDLEDETAVRRVRPAVLGRLGRLDILVNCAALVSAKPLPGWTTPFAEQSTQTFRRALEVNLTAPFLLCQEFTDALTASGHGSIVNVGSIYGLLGPDMRLYDGTPMGNAAGYAATKGGLLQLTRWLATVLAPRIRANSITPGGVFRNQPQPFPNQYAERTPLRRMAAEEDLKGAVAYLASDLSQYVTGQNIVVDGGWTTW